ncbi:MAG: MATE family efflux transporter [Succinivibrio sp.]|nr:MATE family efflux transporter [Succinivibrio sp.]
MHRISLSEHFTFSKLLLFTMPSVAMVISSSVYFIADGFFVSNYVGKTAFAAVNLIMPYLMIISSAGFMLGSGGSAIISALRGQGRQEEADRTFSLMVYTTLIAGLIISVLAYLTLKPVCIYLGAEGELLHYCLVYGEIIIISLPFIMINQEFQILYAAAEQPGLGFKVSVIAGIGNVVLDALFIIGFNWGLTGAAVATVLAETGAGLFPLWYFSGRGGTVFTLGRTRFEPVVLFKICGNGSSELVGELSMSIVAMLYNYQLLKYAGENGVVAYGVLMYLCFLFIGAFVGFTTGSAPIFSYNFGANNHAELHDLLRKSLTLIFMVSMVMFSLSELFKVQLSTVFVGYDAELMKLTVKGFSIVSFSFLFSGLAIFASGFFTALNNGVISAVIAFLRTLCFEVICILTLPLFFGVDGIWYSLVLAEVLAVIVSATFLKLKQPVYHY